VANPVLDNSFVDGCVAVNDDGLYVPQWTDPCDVATPKTGCSEETEDGYQPVPESSWSGDWERWTGCWSRDSEGYFPRTIAPGCEGLKTKDDDGCDYQYTTGYVHDEVSGNHNDCGSCGHLAEEDWPMEIVVYFECVRGCSCACDSGEETNLAMALNGCHILTHMEGSIPYKCWYEKTDWFTGDCRADTESIQLQVYNSSPGNASLFARGIGNAYFYCDGSWRTTDSLSVFSWQNDGSCLDSFKKSGASSWREITNCSCTGGCGYGGTAYFEPYPLNCDGP